MRWGHSQSTELLALNVFLALGFKPLDRETENLARTCISYRRREIRKDFTEFNLLGGQKGQSVLIINLALSFKSGKIPRYQWRAVHGC